MGSYAQRLTSWSGVRPSTVGVFVGRAALTLLAILNGRILTEIFAPGQMGRMAMYMAVVGLFSLITANPMHGYVKRKFHGWMEGRVFGRNFLRYLVAATIFSAISAAVVMQLFHWYVPEVQLSSFFLPVFVAGGVLVSSTQNLVIWLHNLLEKRLTFIAYSAASIVGTLVIGGLFVHNITSQPVEYWLLGALITHVLVGAAALIHLRAIIKDPPLQFAKPSSEGVAQAIRVTLPLSLIALLSWMTTEGYRFSLEWLGGAETLGLFTVGFLIGGTLVRFHESITDQILLPKLYKQIASEKRHDQEQAWRHYVGIKWPTLFLTMAAGFGLSEHLLGLMASPSYSDALPYVRFGVFAEGARLLLRSYSVVGHARLNTVRSIPGIAVGALVVAVMPFVLTEWLEPGPAVGMALLLGGCATLLVSHLMMRSLMRLKIDILPLAKATVLGLPLTMIALIPYPQSSLIISHITIICLGVLLLLALSRKVILTTPHLESSMASKYFYPR